ncbi:MAG: type II secretion system protein N [Candidatus Auribacterota bacterium]|nr:type II secretion system protein N [Candidatus Auribacterota bacterium]
MLTRRQITMLNLVLAIVLIAGGGYMAWSYYRVRPVEEKFTISGRELGPAAAVTPPGEEYYEIIVSRNLWREKFAAPEEAPLATPPPPKIPPPRLKLLGTSIRRDPARSSAFIEEVSNRKQNLYKVNDVVAGATVLEIHRNEVILDFKGNIFTISSFKDSIKVDKSKIPIKRIIRPLGKNKFLISKKGLWKLISNNKWLVSKKGLWQYINVKKANIMVKEVVPAIMKSLIGVGCRPYYPPGKPRRGDAEGYEILVIPPRHISIHLGIKKGDIIRAVNEKVITSKERALELLQEVQGEEKVIVEIEREKEKLELEYIIQLELLELN